MRRFPCASVRNLSRSSGGMRPCAAKTVVPTPTSAPLRVAELRSIVVDFAHVRLDRLAGRHRMRCLDQGGEPKTKWHPFWCRHCPTSVKPLPSASPTSPQPSPVTPTPVKPLPSAPPTSPLPSPVAPKAGDKKRHCVLLVESGMQIPCGCPKISSPVCGADGESYENPCLAKCAGTTVACSGFCPCVAKPGADSVAEHSSLVAKIHPSRHQPPY